MSTNSQIIEDLRYFVDNASLENRASFLDSLKSFAASLISPVSIPFSLPAPKPVSELGGSGAGLVGNPEFVAYCTENGFDLDSKLAQLWFRQGNRATSSQIFDFCDTLPATMTGDAWEFAARHVLAMRSQAS